MLVKEGAGWTKVKTPFGAGSLDVLATTDVDGDGHAEALVYEGYANDFGFHVLGNDWKAPLYRFSCGNI